MDRKSYQELLKRTRAVDPQYDADSLHDTFIETGTDDVKKLRLYAKRRALDERRRIRRRTGGSPPERLTSTNSFFDPYAEVEKADLRERVTNSLMLLTPQQRQLAIALWWHELRPTEIASLLKVCVKTVYRRKNALCALLRTLLDECAPNSN